MANLLKASGGAVRAADVLLRGTGGRVVRLRLPIPAIPGDSSEQLGLAVPEFQDVDLAPVALYSMKAGSNKVRKMLVSATAMNALVGSLGYSAASVVFSVAFGVLVDGVLLEVVSATECEVGGEPYLYQVILQVPTALTV